jgi:hypothetical protein
MLCCKELLNSKQTINKQPRHRQIDLDYTLFYLDKVAQSIINRYNKNYINCSISGSINVSMDDIPFKVVGTPYDSFKLN